MKRTVDKLSKRAGKCTVSARSKTNDLGHMNKVRPQGQKWVCGVLQKFLRLTRVSKLMIIPIEHNSWKIINQILRSFRKNRYFEQRLSPYYVFVVHWISRCTSKKISPWSFHSLCLIVVVICQVLTKFPSIFVSRPVSSINTRQFIATVSLFSFIGLFCNITNSATPGGEFSGRRKRLHAILSYGKIVHGYVVPSVCLFWHSAAVCVQIMSQSDLIYHFQQRVTADRKRRGDMRWVGVVSWRPIHRRGRSWCTREEGRYEHSHRKDVYVDMENNYYDGSSSIVWRYSYSTID